VQGEVTLGQVDSAVGVGGSHHLGVTREARLEVLELSRAGTELQEQRPPRHVDRMLDIMQPVGELQIDVERHAAVA
jgi:hypothetical protein